MIKEPPRNHTSIYISPHLKSRWDDFQKFVTAKGFSSFNGYANHAIVDDFNRNYATVMKNPKKKEGVPRLDMYEMPPMVVKDKLNAYSDGELYDLVKMISDFRNLIIREARKRDIKL